MAFIEYNPAKGSLRPGSAKLTKTHLILSPDIIDQLNSKNVSIAYDPDIKTLKLTPADGGLKITDGKIQSKGFTKFFDIKQRGLFDANWDSKEGSVFIKLGN